MGLRVFVVFWLMVMCCDLVMVCVLLKILLLRVLIVRIFLLCWVVLFSGFGIGVLCWRLV